MNISLPFPRFEHRSIAAIKNDINEELEFHIQCRIDDLVAEGLTTEEATQQAQTAFGSTESIQKQCERIDMGGHRLLAMLALGTLLILGALIGWLSWQLLLVQSQNAEMAQQLVAAESSAMAVAAQEELQDLKGSVKGPDGAVADAKVLLIFKSWPRGNYRQESLSTTTDENGNFVFEELYQTGMQTAYLVSIVKDGYTLESKYWIHNKKGKVKPVKMRVKTAIEKTLTVLGPDGNPLADTEVFLQSRNLKPNGSGDTIYSQSSNEVMQTTDKDGKVSMPYLVAKDKAVVVAYVDDRAVEIKFRADAEPEQTVGGPADEADKSDLTGIVTDDDGKPVAEAIVLLVHKDWPQGYRQRFYKTTTDEDGKFKFPDRYDPGKQYGFLVSIIADGVTMESEYVFNRNGGKQKPFKFRLKEAINKTFVFEDEDGNAITTADVFPSMRKTAGGDEHFMFPHSAPDLDAKTDREGLVQFNHFVAGDVVTFGFTNGSKAEVEIDDQAEQVVTVKKK